MKYLLILYFLCLLGKFANGQNSVQEKDFINQVITERNIIYQDSISSYSLSRLQMALAYSKAAIFSKMRPDSVRFIDDAGKESTMLKSEATNLLMTNISGGRITPSRIIPIVADTIILSEKEIVSINSQFKKGSMYKWDNDLIAGAKQIAADTVSAVFKDWRLRGWQEMYKKGIRSYYSFGAPAFIRNDTYCVFYYDRSCGDLCGEGKLAIYKNENGKWYFWGDIITWIS